MAIKNTPKNNSKNAPEDAQIKAIVESFELRFNTIFESIELKIKDTNTRLSNLEASASELKENFSKLENKLSSIKSDISPSDNSPSISVSSELNRIHNGIYELHTELDRLHNHFPYNHFFSYNEISDGIEIIRFTPVSSITKVIIPPVIDGKPVISIGESAFAGSDVTEVYLPNTVKKIGAAAFKDCSALVTVFMSKNLITLGENAFDGCTSLTSVDLPQNIDTKDFF